MSEHPEIAAAVAQASAAHEAVLALTVRHDAERRLMAERHAAELIAPEAAYVAAAAEARAVIVRVMGYHAPGTRLTAEVQGQTGKARTLTLTVQSVSVTPEGALAGYVVLRGASVYEIRWWMSADPIMTRKSDGNVAGWVKSLTVAPG